MNKEFITHCLRALDCLSGLFWVGSLKSQKIGMFAKADTLKVDSEVSYHVFQFMIPLLKMAKVKSC